MTPRSFLGSLALGFFLACPGMYGSANALTVELTAGSVVLGTDVASMDVRGNGFHLTAFASFFGNWPLDHPDQFAGGRFFASFNVVDDADPQTSCRPPWQCFSGTFTLDGVTHVFRDDPASARIVPAVAFQLPTQSGVWQFELPFTLSISLPTFDVFATGQGVLPVNITCDAPNGTGPCTVSAHVYRIGVPAPSPGILLLAGLPVVAVWFALRRRLD